MTIRDRINAYAQAPEAVPVARFSDGSVLLALRCKPRGAPLLRADHTARRMVRVQRRTRNRLDWEAGS